jgi:phosphoglycolate phosphatase-like HAD superfamily hydrolase
VIKNIIFDFDGVILESNDIKIDGFYELFLEYGEDSANMISNYFRNNAGLSRYDIIKYFFQKLFNEDIDELKLLEFAKKYSDIVMKKVICADFVKGCKEFIEENITYELFIVSSSDEKDLRYICDKINISKYFKEILGSPIKKEINIKNIINTYNLLRNETIYIGDSINDYNATIKNNLLFIGRNSGVYDFNTLSSVIVIENLENLHKQIKEIMC